MLILKPLPLLEADTDEESGHAIIKRPRFKSAFFQRLFAKDRPFARIYLDDYGTFVWKHLDGKTTLEEIAASFAVQFPDEENPQARVVLFVNQLHRNGFVGYSVE